MQRKKLLWQLYPSYLIITLTILFLASLAVAHFFSDFFIKQKRAELETAGKLLRGRTQNLVLEGKRDRLEHTINRLGRDSSIRITIILPSGKVIADSNKDPTAMENHANRPEIISASQGQTGTSTRFSNTLNQKMLYVALPLFGNAGIIGVQRLALPVTGIEKAIRSFFAGVSVAFVFIALLLAIISLLLTRKITRPLNQMKIRALEFAEGNLDARIPVPDIEEFAALAEVLNRAARQLSEKIQTIVKQHNELHAILEGMSEGVIALDTEEHISNINNAAMELLGINEDQVLGKTIQEAIRNSRLQRFIAELASGEKPEKTEISLSNPEERIVLAYGKRISNSAGEFGGTLLVINDITEMRRLENVRRDFVANVSHELKTPITSIKGFVETLLSGALNNEDELKRFLQIIEKHANRLNAIIDDLLSLSRIERNTGQTRIELEEGRLADVLESARQLSQIKAQRKKIKLEVKCPEVISGKINAALLEQAIVNLIDNAVKYSEEGQTVVLHCETKGNEIVISVADQGCGIDQQHLPRLFERFYRVDKARSRELGGTGLGLALVKHITQAHDGRVEVQSVKGKGSTFSIILPAVVLS